MMVTPRGFTTSDDKYNDGKPNSPTDGLYESLYYMDVDSKIYKNIVLSTSESHALCH